MSRIGKAPVVLTGGAKASISGQTVVVEGPKGKLTHTVHERVAVSLEDNAIVLTRSGDEPFERSIHGTSRALIANLVKGVTTGFSISLELVGVGYRVEQKGTGLNLVLGFSHHCPIEAPAGITLKAESNTKLVITGTDKQAVGQIAADIRSLRPPEPYKGKGVLYTGEVVRRKQGKRTGK